MANTLEITLLTDIRDSLKNVDKFVKEATTGVNKVGDQFQDLGKKVPQDVFKGAFGAELAIKGVEALISVFERAVDVVLDGVQAAAREEAALSALTEALRANGAATQKNISGAEAFAEQLERTTKFGSDAALSAQALLASLTGLSGTGLNKATQAAADLATVLGVDLDTAARKIAKAAQGGDEQFARLGIRFVKGATDAETFQNVLAGIERQLGGRAQAAANTFTGALIIMQNAVENITKAIGEVVIKSPQLIAVFQTITAAAGSIVASIKSNGPAIADFFNTLVSSVFKAGVEIFVFAKNLSQIGFGSGIQTIVNAFVQLGIATGFAKGSLSTITNLFGILAGVTLVLSAAFNIFVAALKLAGGNIASVVLVIADLLSGIRTFITLISGGQITEAFASLATTGKDAINTFLEPFAKAKDDVTGIVSGFLDGAKGISKGLEESGKEAKKATDEVAKLADKIKEAASGSTKKTIETEIKINVLSQLEQGFKNFVANVHGLLSQKGKEGSQERQQQDFVVGTITKATKAFVGGIAQGKEGAYAAFNAIIDGIADIAAKALSAIPIAGPIIAAVAEVIKFLARGAEFVKKQSEEFFAEFEKIPTNILQALPVLISRILGIETVNFLKNLINAIPTFIFQLFSSILAGIPLIIKDLAKNMPKLIAATITLLPRIVVAFISALIFEIPKLIPAIGIAMYEGIIEAFDNVKKQGEGVVQGAGDFFGGVGDFFGFADGGRVPNLTQFENDGGLARVSAGEQVFNKDLTGDLERFLSSQGGGEGGGGSRNLTVNLVIGERQLASVLLDLNRNGFRVTA